MPSNSTIQRFLASEARDALGPLIESGDVQGMSSEDLEQLDSKLGQVEALVTHELNARAQASQDQASVET